MKAKLPMIAGVLLGVMFIVFGLNFFLKFIPMGDPPPEGSPPALFMGALIPTGYFAFVKVCEIIGGVLTVIPRTRNWGLLVLGPIVVNILLFNIFLTKGAGLAQPPVIAVAVLSAFLLWAGRDKFLNLLNS